MWRIVSESIQIGQNEHKKLMLNDVIDNEVDTEEDESDAISHIMQYTRHQFIKYKLYIMWIDEKMETLE